MRVYAQLHTHNIVFKKVLASYPKQKSGHAQKKAGPCSENCGLLHYCVGTCLLGITLNPKPLLITCAMVFVVWVACVVVCGWFVCQVIHACCSSTVSWGSGRAKTMKIMALKQSLSWCTWYLWLYFRAFTSVTKLRKIQRHLLYYLRNAHIVALPRHEHVRTQHIRCHDNVNCQEIPVVRAYFLHCMISRYSQHHVQGEALVIEYLYEYLVYDRKPAVGSISVHMHT